jgi:hypothetical protein
VRLPQPFILSAHVGRFAQLARASLLRTTTGRRWRLSLSSIVRGAGMLFSSDDQQPTNQVVGNLKGFPMRMPKVTSSLAMALFVAATEPANAVVVEYTLTFAGTGSGRADGTGTLVVNEPTPINSFSEIFYGDLVSLTANIGGRKYNFAPSSVIVDLGTNQTFHGITGSSSPDVVGSNGFLGILVLGGFGFWIVNAGGPPS